MPLPVDDASDLTVQTWRFLENEMEEAQTPLEGPVVPVLDFLEKADDDRTTPAERLAIIEQAELLFTHLYPHMPFKRDLFPKADPFRFLNVARAGMEDDPEMVFQGLMVAAFAVVRDAHTTYGLPSPYRGSIAFLPFQMRPVRINGKRRYVVTRVMKGTPEFGFGHEFFQPGAEIVKWGTSSIGDHVERVAEWLPGGNVEAKFARGTLACTLRPLTSVHPPFDDEMPAAKIRYRPAGSSEERVILLPWGVARFTRTAEIPGGSFSESTVQEDYRRAMRAQYRDDRWKAKKQRFAASEDLREVSNIPQVFEFQFTGGPRTDDPIDLNDLAQPSRPDARFGYLRIKAFRDGGQSFGMTERLVEEAHRILTLLDEEAPDGLVLDIRGNPGGDIIAAERILQMLTPDRIQPENFHFANTEAIRDILRRVRDREAPEDARVEFEPWAGDADRASDSENPHLTSGLPLTHPDEANDIGQIYHGPVVLLTDAFTYSAADIFAAGFQDHAIGFLLGAEAFTGGGGANVFNHGELVAKLGPDLGLPLVRLPRDITMRVALRRCSRVGFNPGQPIEDLGVRMNEIYQPNSVDEVMDEFPGMVRRAVRMFKLRPEFRVDVAGLDVRNDVFTITVRSTNVTSLRFFMDGQLAAERRIKANEVRQFRISARDRVSPSKLRIEGFAPRGDPETGKIKGRIITSARTIHLRKKVDARVDFLL
jgi:hypothetical protein